MPKEEDQKLERIRNLCEILPKLTNRQIEYIENVVRQLQKPFIETFLKPDSDIISECVLFNLGDSIRIHHCFSNSPFTKDKFEYAMDAVLNYCGIESRLAPQGLPGYDLIIGNLKISLKTEAESNIHIDRIHISKMMELGRGEWNYEALRQQFINHLDNYDRIFTLRCLSKNPLNRYYELVEIPKNILNESSNGVFRIMNNSRQSLKPAYCDVKNKDNELIFQLYFDGGGERKLQIKNLRKDNCIIQAFWKFSTN
jgi:hypothetical protein